VAVWAIRRRARRGQNVRESAPTPTMLPDLGTQVKCIEEYSAGGSSDLAETTRETATVARRTAAGPAPATSQPCSCRARLGGTREASSPGPASTSSAAPTIAAMVSNPSGMAAEKGAGKPVTLRR